MWQLNILPGFLCMVKSCARGVGSAQWLIPGIPSWCSCLNSAQNDTLPFPRDRDVKPAQEIVNTFFYTHGPRAFSVAWFPCCHVGWKCALLLFFFFLFYVALLIITVSLHVSFVLAEYLRGNVLPAEQHATSDLSCILHPNAHLKALTEPHDQHARVDSFLLPTTKLGRVRFQFSPFRSTCVVIQASTNPAGTVLIKALTVTMLKGLNSCTWELEPVSPQYSCWSDVFVPPGCGSGGERYGVVTSSAAEIPALPFNVACGFMQKPVLEAQPEDDVSSSVEVISCGSHRQ